MIYVDKKLLTLRLQSYYVWNKSYKDYFSLQFHLKKRN